MGRRYEVEAREEDVVGRQGFLQKGVKAGAEEFVFLQGLAQGVFIDDAAARRVDEDAARRSSLAPIMWRVASVRGTDTEMTSQV